MAADPRATGTLDLFGRADETPLAAPWLQHARPADQNVNLASNTLRGSSLGSHNTAIYDAASYAANQEAWAVLAMAPVGAFCEIGLLLRVSEPNSGNVDFISLGLQWNSSSSVDWEICTSVDNTANFSADVQVNTAHNIVTGNILYASVIGRTISGYIFNGGDWTKVIEATMNGVNMLIVDPPGQVGVRLLPVTNTSSVGVTQFGGGAIPGPVDSMEKTSGAWANLMREVRLDGLADGRSGNRGDGTESWRVGAYD